MLGLFISVDLVETYRGLNCWHLIIFHDWINLNFFTTDFWQPTVFGASGGRQCRLINRTKTREIFDQIWTPSDERRMFYTLVWEFVHVPLRIHDYTINLRYVNVAKLSGSNRSVLQEVSHVLSSLTLVFLNIDHWHVKLHADFLNSRPKWWLFM